jgi:valyl-tRNA synthetase
VNLEKSYDPKKYEADIYRLWEGSGAFEPSKDAKGSPFSIILPPPNANGDLHLGHAMYVVEDIMARYHRMKSDPTLWLPGADHAGIETQVVFERHLAKEGKSRFDLGREEFYKQALAFTQKNRASMESQLKSLGFSLDWSRNVFTLDAKVIETVYATFKKLHEDGLIYRGNRIVNWCPSCKSGFADIEIKYREQIDPLYYIKYGPFVLATVRPETKFGDTAVAVHPEDERYAQYIGQAIEADDVLGPIRLKVIADEFVDPNFGTGVIKVTPAHDPNDWEIGLRHGLEVKQAIGTDGRLTDIAGRYAGMTVDEARRAVAQALQDKGLMDHVDMNYTHSIAYHDRCGTPIEPLVTEQWWLKVEPLTRPAIQAIESGEVTFVPSRFKSIALNWLKNLRDWNISRQNWFGISIPVYYGTAQGKDPYIIGTEEEAKAYYGEGNYEAETDTFDTWFSSGQWPVATLTATGDLDRFYPTSVMDTGRDILFLWVTRMIMLGIYLQGKVPFRTVYLHGLINDEHGKKMSKSKGNVINPLEMTDKYGTDALRLALTIGVTPGNDGSLGEKKVESYRNFCNKLWNVSRFILAQTENYAPKPPTPTNLADRYILGNISHETSNISKAIENYRFSEAAERVYSLLWDDFADWYIEASKGSANLPVLVHCLESILKLAHPFAPFITEAIWQKMAWQKEKLILSSWPEPGKSYEQEVDDFKRLRELITELRNLKAEMNLDHLILAHDDSLIGENEELIRKLAKVNEFEKNSGKGLLLAAGGFECRVMLDNISLAAYRTRIEERLAEHRAYLEKLDKQLANKAYLESAPEQIVKQTRDRKQETEMLVSKLNEQLQALSKQ